MNLYKSAKSLKIGDIVLCKESDFRKNIPVNRDLVIDLSIVDMEFINQQCYRIKSVWGWHEVRNVINGYDTIEKPVETKVLQFPKKPLNRGRSVD